MLLSCRRVQQQLEGSKSFKANIRILPLYGNLPSEQQDEAVLPDPYGELLCHSLCTHQMLQMACCVALEAAFMSQLYSCTATADYLAQG